jgi:hypothetical protein
MFLHEVLAIGTRCRAFEEIFSCSDDLTPEDLTPLAESAFRQYKLELPKFPKENCFGTFPGKLGTSGRE